MNAVWWMMGGIAVAMLVAGLYLARKLPGKK